MYWERSGAVRFAYALEWQRCSVLDTATRNGAMSLNEDVEGRRRERIRLSAVPLAGKLDDQLKS